MVLVRWAGKSMRAALVFGACLVIITGATVGIDTSRPQQALAATQCHLSSMSPHSGPNGSEIGFSFFIIDNTDALAWIKVTAPNPNVVIDNANSDWLPDITIDSTFATYSGSAISPGNTIEVDASAIVNTYPASSWTIEASTDQGGANPMTCDGDASFSVTDTTPPQITNIAVQSVTTSATVNWSTDKTADSRVDYGKTASYGKNVTDGSFVTGHSLQITGLSPATTYHYRITSTDQSGNTSSSVDGTFFTASVPVSSTSSGSSTQSNTPVSVKVTTPSDKKPPTIHLTSVMPAVATSIPTVTGVANDETAVAKVEYSVDGGQNWLPVDHAKGLGGKSVTFDFTPLNLDDNTYSFVARAIDGGGNTATTDKFAVVIDRFPPVVGGMVIALGPQVLVPDDSGRITTLPGVDLSVSLSTTGGANMVVLSATTSTSKTAFGTFALKQDPDSGLWSGTLSFSRAGTYQLMAHTRDGAGNATDRQLATVTVLRQGAVLSTNGPVAKATITAYFRDADTGNWVVWDGAPYGQTNPSHTGNSGAFSLLLPAGTYYLNASAAGYQSLNSASFTLTQPTPIAAVLHLQAAFGIGPIQLPWISFATQAVTSYQAIKTTKGDGTSSSLIGNTLPTITLTNTEGQAENNVEWLGKPTVLSVMSTWAPATAEQATALDALAKNQDVNVKAIGLQENSARLRAYDAIGGLTLSWLADPTGQTAGALHTSSIPMHLFVDRKGVVRKIVYGVLSQEQLTTELTDLP